jgi:hypothetical protein
VAQVAQANPIHIVQHPCPFYLLAVSLRMELREVPPLRIGPENEVFDAVRFAFVKRRITPVKTESSVYGEKNRGNQEPVVQAFKGRSMRGIEGKGREIHQGRRADESRHLVPTEIFEKLAPQRNSTETNTHQRTLP